MATASKTMSLFGFSKFALDLATLLQTLLIFSGSQASPTSSDCCSFFAVRVLVKLMAEYSSSFPSAVLALYLCFAPQRASGPSLLFLPSSLWVFTLAILCTLSTIWIEPNCMPCRRAICTMSVSIPSKTRNLPRSSNRSRNTVKVE